jgi:hypothetical protein
MMYDFFCRRCGSASLVVSSRKTIVEKPLGLFVIPYRCASCQCRQWKFRFVPLPPLAADTKLSGREAGRGV